MPILLKSRRFWIAIVDAAVGSIALALDHFWPPAQGVFIILWGYWQPVVIVVIIAYTVDDIAARIVAAWERIRARA